LKKKQKCSVTRFALEIVFTKRDPAESFKRRSVSGSVD
jgi:hypothetical protein